MSSIRSYSRRAGSLFAVAALALATLTPGLIPAFASAAQLTERSIELSSASAKATDVTYNVKFTSESDAGAVVLNFCSNSPLINSACDAPVGFDATNIDTSSAGWTATSPNANTVILSGTDVIEGTVETAVLAENITNPDDAGALYVRIVTYANATVAGTYTPTATPNSIDQAGAAVSILNTIGVSGAVLESMTFCVAGPTVDPQDEEALVPTVIEDNCANAGALPKPSLELGEKISSSVTALQADVVSTGSLYGQISTNAASGAVVNLKSGAAGCGGLIRQGAGTCDIAPAQTDNVVGGGPARFGARILMPNVSGDGLLRTAGLYNASTYVMTYATDQLTGVTSTYGDPFFDTDNQPASNKNLEIQFGATVTPNTPAGLYQADLSLIATGKF